MGVGAGGQGVELKKLRANIMYWTNWSKARLAQFNLEVVIFFLEQFGKLNNVD